MIYSYFTRYGANFSTRFPTAAGKDTEPFVVTKTQITHGSCSKVRVPAGLHAFCCQVPEAQVQRLDGTLCKQQVCVPSDGPELGTSVFSVHTVSKPAL